MTGAEGVSCSMADEGASSETLIYIRVLGLLQGTPDVLPARSVGVHFLGNIAGGIAADEDVACALLQDVELCGVCVALADDGGSPADHLQRHATENSLPRWQRQHVKEQIALNSALCMSTQNVTACWYVKAPFCLRSSERAVSLHALRLV